MGTTSVLDAAVELIAATSRWNRGESRSYHMSGTLWYGIMCRSFLLLERMLRLGLIVLTGPSGIEIRNATKRHAASKPLERMTMGQCLGVLENIAPEISSIFACRHPDLWTEEGVYPSADRDAWARILALRNRMIHEGPGFVESTDVFAGRVWRRYRPQEPRDQQAREVWGLGRQLCKSRVILAAMSLEGVAPVGALDLMLQAESREFNLQELELAAPRVIDEFHAVSAPDV